MKYKIVVFGLMICALLLLNSGCGTNYIDEMSGVYVPLNSETQNIKDSFILYLYPDGKFLYKIQNKNILSGKWKAEELREMTTITFDASGNIKWKSSGGTFNPPDCNQIIPWNPQYFKLPNDEKIIFKKL